MIQKRSVSGTVFDIFNHFLMIFLAVVCIFPFIHVIALSFSSNAAIEGGLVTMWPVYFQTNAYEYVLKESAFWTSFWVTLKRLVMVVPYQLLMTLLMAYPLSRPSNKFYGRSLYVVFLIFCSMFSGGLVPSYMLYAEVGLINSMWVFVIPGAVKTGYILLVMNFIRNLPSDLFDAAHIDGASEMRTLFSVVLPLLKPSVATITLYLVVANWNDYFSGMIYMNSAKNYPLSTYIYNLIQQTKEMTGQNLTGEGGEEWRLLESLNGKSIEAAQIVISIIPILMIYPLLQKYFVKGIVLGSVKG